MTYEYEVSGYGLKTEQLDMKSLARVIRFNKESGLIVYTDKAEVYGMHI